MKKIILSVMLMLFTSLASADLTLTPGEGIDIIKSGVGGTVTVSGEDATSANKGIASFDATDFSMSSGAVSLGANPTVSGTLTAGAFSGDGSALTGIDGMVYPGAGIAVSTGTAWGTSITDASTNWNTAYTDRLKWDGGNTGLTAATGRTSLGLGTAAQSNTGDFLAAGGTAVNSSLLEGKAAAYFAVASGTTLTTSTPTNLTGFIKGNGSVLSADNSTYLTAVASDSTWTVHGSYPSDCPAGQYVYGLGDTLSCRADLTGGGGSISGLSPNYFTIAGSATTIVDSVMYQLGTTNIGIGTITPSTKLQVVGTVTATAFVGNGSGLTGVSTISGLTAGKHAKALTASTLTDSIIYDDGTNVGVGTTAPRTTLDVIGNYISGNGATSTTMALTDTDVTHGVTTIAPTNTWFYVNEISGTKGGVHLVGFSDGTDQEALELRGIMVGTPDDGRAAITLDAYGASGTGVAALGATKTILSVRNNEVEYIKVLGNGNTTFTGTVAGTLATAAQPNVTSVGTLGSLTVTGASTVTTGNLLVTSGNIGIGSATPSQRLDVNGVAKATTFSGAGTSLTGTAASLSVGTATTAGTVTVAAQPTITSVGTLTALTVSGASTLTGNVGIGTTAVSTYKLQVDGQVYVAGGSTGNVGIGTTTTTAKLTVNGSIATVSTGNTGIGTTAPVAKLQVGSPTIGNVSGSVNNVAIQGAVEIDSNLYVDGLLYGGGNLGLGILAPVHKLSVDGSIYAKGINTTATGHGTGKLICIGTDNIIYAVSSGTCF